MKSQSNIRIYGGDDSTVWIAPKGSTLPADLAELTTPYQDAGFLGADGIEQSVETENTEVRVHQGYRIARTKITGQKDTFTFICSETNAVSIGLMYPGSTTTTVGGVTRIDGQERTKRNELVFVVDEYDEDIHKRIVYSLAEVTERGAVAHKANEETIYEFTVTSYGEIFTLTNDPALAVEPTV